MRRLLLALVLVSFASLSAAADGPSGPGPEKGAAAGKEATKTKKPAKKTKKSSSQKKAKKASTAKK